MSLLVYANPQGATTNTPFPTDASRKIYFQEVNNMFDQVRLFINGNIDPVNFNLPFVQSLTWAISGSNQALNIASTSTNSAIDIAQTTSVMTAGKGLVQLSTDALNPATTSIVKLIQNNISDNATIWHAETDSTAAAARWMRITSVGAGTEYWSFHRDAASSEVRSNVKTGDSHVFQVNGVEAAKIAATSMTLPTAGNLIIGSSTLSNDDLSLSDTGTIKFGTTTIQQGLNDTEIRVNALRLTSNTGAVISSPLAGILNVDAKIQLVDANGPILSKGATKELVIEDTIQLTTSNSIKIKKTSNSKGIAIQATGATYRAAVIGSNEVECLKLVRGRIFTNGNVVQQGEDFSVSGAAAEETTVTFASAYGAVPTVIVSSDTSPPGIVNRDARLVSVSETAFTVRGYKSKDDNTPIELTFSFIAVGPRGAD